MYTQACDFNWNLEQGNCVGEKSRLHDSCLKQVVESLHSSFKTSAYTHRSLFLVFFSLVGSDASCFLLSLVPLPRNLSCLWFLGVIYIYRELLRYNIQFQAFNNPSVVQLLYTHTHTKRWIVSVVKKKNCVE